MGFAVFFGASLDLFEVARGIDQYVKGFRTQIREGGVRAR